MGDEGRRVQVLSGQKRKGGNEPATKYQVCDPGSELRLCVGGLLYEKRRAKTVIGVQQKEIKKHKRGKERRGGGYHAWTYS